jgi:hypothetical protein
LKRWPVGLCVVCPTTSPLLLNRPILRASTRAARRRANFFDEWNQQPGALSRSEWMQLKPLFTSAKVRPRARATSAPSKKRIPLGCEFFISRASPRAAIDNKYIILKSPSCVNMKRREGGHAAF